ncbi:alpha/beta hydrolase fold domain-containing protein [Microbulbifer sp. SH-1]|uniref:alpha/beta hydrolase n=1 Tax=Microbulbifer sp. SH-1 TaxID=2681547 RepID=UPI00140E3BC0|nr:alpha/beta hydrolase [Microbulbifer sp. SH-1]QIL90980.1 alpha/beta hydrolase fold domain-containing protein [Microbulbifer sp. SH-1]
MRQLEPKLEEWLAAVNTQIAQLKAAGFEATPVNARESLANLTRTFVEPGPDMAVADTLVTGGEYAVPVRVYQPVDAIDGAAIIYCHGGGHMAGSVSVYDPICRRVAAACQRPVISVEYRLAPENPYPAALNDLISVVRHLGTALDRKGVAHNGRWILMGDSGGGALCASASRLLQHQPHNIDAQVLIYPSLDYTMQTPSIEENGRGYLLEKEKILWYFQNYFQHAENPYQASPLHGEFTRNMPAALVVTAEFCPLRDEGVEYVRKVREGGANAEHLHFGDMIHAFLNIESLVPEACGRVYRHVAEYLRGV